LRLELKTQSIVLEEIKRQGAENSQKLDRISATTDATQTTTENVERKLDTTHDMLRSLQKSADDQKELLERVLKPGEFRISPHVLQDGPWFSIIYALMLPCSPPPKKNEIHNP
jgi:hypothetical protein